MPVRMRPFIMMFPAVMPRAVTVAVLCRHIALRQNRKIKSPPPQPKPKSPEIQPGGADTPNPALTPQNGADFPPQTA